MAHFHLPESPEEFDDEYAQYGDDAGEEATVDADKGEKEAAAE